MLLVAAGVLGLILYVAYDASFDAIMSRATWLAIVGPLVWFLRKRAIGARDGVGRRER